MKVLQKQKQERDGRQAGWLRQRLQKFTAWLSGKKGVHYINGSQTLPPPLNRQEEEEVFSDLLSCEEPVKQSARQLLIEHNLRLVVYIAKKFESTGINIEDLISIGTIGLIKAVNTFSPEKNIKLATYASRCIENEILMYLRKNQNRRREISIDEPLNIDWTFYCTKCDGMASMRTCPHGKEDRVILSGTKLRKFLSEGQPIPDHFGRNEVLDILRDYYSHLTNKVEIKMQHAASGPAE